MMRINAEKIETYLALKKTIWSKTSLVSARSRLRTIESVSKTLDPREVFDALKAKGFTLYSIQTYFFIAKGYEERMCRSKDFERFLEDHSFLFRNAYQDKEIRVTEEQFIRALAKAPSAEIFNLLVLAGKCGLRRTEALKAKWADIENNCLTVLGKGGKVRQIPVRKTWLKKVDSPFIAGTHPGYMYFFDKKLPFGFHDLRAFYATNLVHIPSISIKDAAVVLGHSNVQTTQRYLRVDFERIQNVLLKE